MFSIHFIWNWQETIVSTYNQDNVHGSLVRKSPFFSYFTKLCLILHWQGKHFLGPQGWSFPYIILILFWQWGKILQVWLYNKNHLLQYFTQSVFLLSYLKKLFNFLFLSKCLSPQRVTSLCGRRSEGKGKGIRVQHHARRRREEGGGVPFLSPWCDLHAIACAQIPPSPSPFNAGHTG